MFAWLAVCSVIGIISRKRTGFKLETNGFSDLGVGIAGSCLGKLIVLSAGLIFEGVTTGSFFTTGTLLLLGLFCKGLSLDYTLVSTVKLSKFVTEDACVFR